MKLFKLFQLKERKESQCDVNFGNWTRSRYNDQQLYQLASRISCKKSDGVEGQLKIKRLRSERNL
ncbi:hypothetical protein K0M31_010554 [Melipona bicolor]|uniref:Uncharacterized protein n=1 Tax=Melipona bicolor TaxID=60889 RepID=A0AA40FLX2_9HYME|nr:hypothetical protein K0M31_010554 [Melipona bicolor]